MKKQGKNDEKDTKSDTTRAHEVCTVFSTSHRVLWNATRTLTIVELTLALFIVDDQFKL